MEIIVKRKNIHNKLMYIYIFLLPVACSIFWGLEIYKDTIGNDISSDQEKIMQYLERVKVLYPIINFLEIFILIAPILLLAIFIVRDIEHNNNEFFKKFCIIHVCFTIFIFLMSFILSNIFNMHHTGFSILIIYLSPSITIAIFIVFLKLVSKLFEMIMHKK